MISIFCYLFKLHISLSPNVVDLQFIWFNKISVQVTNVIEPVFHFIQKTYSPNSHHIILNTSKDIKLFCKSFLAPELLLYSFILSISFLVLFTGFLHF